MSIKEIECAVYKSLKKDETYVFIPTQTSLSDLPEDLIKILGQAEMIMTLTLTPEKKMARGTATSIIEGLNKNGFYLQIPEKPHINVTPAYHEKLSEKNIADKL